VKWGFERNFYASNSLAFGPMIFQPEISKVMNSSLSDGGMSLVGSEIGSVHLVPADFCAFKWHKDLVKMERLLPLAEAAKKMILTLCAFAAFALYFSFNYLAIGPDAYHAVYQLFLLIGFISFPLASIWAFYFKHRKAFLARSLYEAGYRVTENDQLVTNEPNPKTLVRCS
jgi:hypothetical protein